MRRDQLERRPLPSAGHVTRYVPDGKGGIYAWQRDGQVRPLPEVATWAAGYLRALAVEVDDSTPNGMRAALFETADVLRAAAEAEAS